MIEQDIARVLKSARVVVVDKEVTLIFEADTSEMADAMANMLLTKLRHGVIVAAVSEDE
jgi:hypothetical protein